MLKSDNEVAKVTSQCYNLTSVNASLITVKQSLQRKPSHKAAGHNRHMTKGRFIYESDTIRKYQQVF